MPLQRLSGCDELDANYDGGMFRSLTAVPGVGPEQFAGPVRQVVQR